MKIIFSGDRNSKTIRIGRWLMKILNKIGGEKLNRFLAISLWDGYPSKIYFRKA